MDEEERMRKMANFKAMLEKRVKEMETELDGLRALLGFVDDILLERGFKRAEVVKPTPPPPPFRVMQPAVQPEAVPPPEKIEGPIPLKTITGDLLANLYTQEDAMRVVLAEEREFNIHTPPFTSFFVERVLAKMQEKDREAMRKGEIPPDKMLSYNIARDGDVIREITIRNIAPDRLRELKSTIRWTLEKMHEKDMQSA